MSHYFTTDQSAHDYSEISFDFNGEVYRFKTDRGVFSKERVDYGTKTLLEGVVADRHGNPSSMIDMGAGYGPVGIVLGRVLKLEPVMVEVNEDAIALLHDNVERNHIDARILSREEYDRSDVPAGLYVTNPPFRAGKDTVMSIIDDGHERLEEGGAFYMVVQKKQGMKSYKSAIEQKFGNVSTVMKDKGYYVLKGIK
ncbi:class I SAM-dependent methyltransferase [Salinicoccus halitifaciens]|uniref:16S rRNA (Guanine1207-N2)-methyltransferase n=1 Tax=Salinicoccus halitifaciens TaxID=1073415 RepID=A0ABV2E9P0_9STAP|nr:methyltransferase [Salinicoccus halitifaciens]MCD2138268.1 class I SAM-dependent methyltransferase [Salinicoccus halitifaciens]